jgi:hypothetical protein
MTRHLLRLAAAMALVAGAPGPASAQQTEPEPTSWRVPGWSFTPGVTVSGVVDGNVALAAAPADTGRTESDTLFVVQPFGHFEYFSPRTDFSSGYRGLLRRYVDVRGLDGFDQRGYVSLRRLATRRVTVFFNDTFAVVPSTDEIELNGLPFRRTGARTNILASGVEARLTKFVDLAVRYDLTWVDFDRNDTFLTGGWLSGGRAELSRRLSERASVGGEYGVRVADLNDGTREMLFQDAGGTLRVALTADTTLSLAGGMSYLNDRTVGDTRSGPYVRAALVRAVERATVGVSFERTYVPSFGFGGSNQSQELRGVVRMPIGRNRLYLQESAAWRRSDPFVASDLRLDTIWIRTTIGYAAARWLRIEGFHAFTRQDSEVTGGEISRHRAGAQIVLSQPMRIR